MSKTKSFPIPLTGKPGRPSENLTESEHTLLKTLLSGTQTFSGLARMFRMDRKSITRILQNGSGSPENIRKVRNKLEKLKTAA